MISRRNSPDGLPFRLYARAGKFKVSFGYKRPDGKWEFRLSAPTRDKEAVAKAKAEAVERANILNGAAVPDGETAAIFQRYFRWQRDLPRNSQDRKADNTLKENQYEAKRLLRTFGKVKPSVIKPMHVYKYLAARAKEGAPAKANKEIALLSAVLEFGRREGALETNPCRGIKYNKTLPSTKVVSQAEIDFAVRVARERGGAYIVIALCLVTAYLMVNRPDEVRHMRRADIDWDKGIRVAIGKRKGGEAQRYKMISWSPSLLATIKEALSLQRTTSMYRTTLHRQRVQYEPTPADGTLHPPRKGRRDPVLPLHTGEHAPLGGDGSVGRRRFIHRRRDRAYRPPHGRQDV
jgi:integrase